MSEILSFGEWVRRRRRALDLTQGELAARVGCSKELIAKIEGDARRPSKQVAALLASAMQLDAAEHAAFVRAARAELAADRLPPPTRDVPRPTFVAAPKQHSPPSPALEVQVAPLPAGTVTFLFTDIEGSTRLWEQEPQAMRAALARHDAILRQAIEHHGGQIFKTVGDAVCAAFAEAPAALMAAMEAQRALQAADWETATPLRVRIALHTGTAQSEDGDYVGPPLNRVARLLSAGHGGQVLLSLTTHELVRGAPSADTQLRDLGMHRLKDLDHPEAIYQLVAPELPSDFPPLRSLEARRGNLPAPTTALIGRAQELADLTALLAQPDVRLVTLTGPGGIGKTRLALAAAAAIAEQYPDDAWFVDLAPVSDPSQIAAAIAQALGIREAPGLPIQDSVISWLRPKQLLLLLDNCEQIVDGVASLVAALLHQAAHVVVLATSRVPLRLSGEQELPVAPLTLPDLGALPPLEQLGQYDAVALFITRARAVRPDFVITTANAPAVAEICARLDGLPLAIELAAARIRLFTPEALLVRLETSGSLPLLTGGPRNLPARQQTIRTAIAWSYDLLTTDEQALFVQLGVFVGGWTLEGAAAIGAQEGLTLNPTAINSALEALVLHSLVQVVGDVGGEPRFSMLETVREFALEQLHVCGDEAIIEQRHAVWFMTKGTMLLDQLWGTTQASALAALHLDNGNILAALAWMEAHDTDSAVRLIVKLGWYWYWTAHRHEGVAWVERALTHYREDSGQRADLLRVLALLSYDHLPQESCQWIAESLRMARRLGDAERLAETLVCCAQVEFGSGRGTDVTSNYVHEALTLYEQLENPVGIARCLIFEFSLEGWERSLGIFRRAGHRRGIADVLTHLARLRHHSGGSTQAWEFAREAQTIYHQLGDIGGEVWTLLGLGDIAQSTMRLHDALAYYQRAHELAELVNDQNARAWASMNQGEVFARCEDPAAAVSLFRASMLHFFETGDPFGLHMNLMAGAYTAWSTGAFAQGVQLLAALDHRCQVELDVPLEENLPPEHLLFYRFTRAKLQEALGVDSFAEAWLAGSHLAFDDAIEEARYVVAS